MSNSPDIRVRLTAEGVNQVIDAIRKVQQEANNANRIAANGVKVLDSAFGALKGTLAAFGISATIGGLVSFAKQAFNAASETKNFSDQLGVTTEEFSRLAFAANAADIDKSSFAAGLSAYQKRLSEAVINPNSEAAASFKQLGLDAGTLSKLSLTDQIGAIADRVAALAKSEDKAKASSDLFGKGLGPQFVRTLNGGAEAIRKFGEESDKTGNTLNEKTAQSIERADAAIKRLKASLSGGFTQVLGAVADKITPDTTELGKVTAELEKAKLFAAQIQEEGGLTAPIESVRNATQKLLSETQAKILDLEAQRQKLLAPPQNLAQGTGGHSAVLIHVESEAERKARLDALTSRLQEEQKLLDQNAEGVAAADKRAFDQGIISLNEYYARRKELIRAQLAGEVNLANQQIAAIQSVKPQDDAQRIQQATEVEKIRADIKVKQLKTTQDIKAVEGDQIQAQRDLNNELRNVTATLADAENDRHAAFAAHLEDEQQRITEILKRAGESPAEIQAQIDRLTTARTNSFNFDEVQRRGTEALDAFNRDAEQIRRDQEAGIISQLEGQDRLVELEGKRLATLKEISAQALTAAQATGNEDLIAKAKQYADSVDQIAISYRGATDNLTRFKTAGKEGLQQGLENLFQNIDKIHSVGDAFEQLANTVAKSLQDMAAQILSQQITRGITNFAASLAASSAAGASTGGEIGKLAKGGELQRLASGGAVDARGGGVLRGPGTPTSDDMLLWGSTKEFMVRAAATQQEGGLELLHALNDGRVRARDLLRARDFTLSLPRFAGGGLLSGVTPSQGGSGQDRTRSRGAGGVAINVTVQAPNGQVSTQTLNQTTAAVARAIQRANARQN